VLAFIREKLILFIFTVPIYVQYSFSASQSNTYQKKLMLY